MTDTDAGLYLGALGGGIEFGLHADEEGGSGGGGGFFVGAAGGVGAVVEEFGCGGRGHGHAAVCALNGAAADFEGGADDAVDLEEVPADGGSDDVDDGVYGSDFVEMDVFGGDAVDGAFCLCECSEAVDCMGLNFVFEGGGLDGFADFAEGAMVVMVIVMVVSMLVLAVSV